MSRDPYTPSPADLAHIEKDGENWTLVLTKELRHSPEKVWAALTEPSQLKEWAPFEVDRNIGSVGKVAMTWVDATEADEANITRAETERVLEYKEIRWELEPLGQGTRLKLWHKIDRRYIAMGAAGWHVCFDVLDHFLNGDPIGRICGQTALHNQGWQQLHKEYSTQFGVEPPAWPSKE